MLKKSILMVAICLFLIVVLVSSMWMSSTDKSVASNLDGLPPTPSPDVDSPADTIKTLTATVQSLTQSMNDLRIENDELMRERESFEIRIGNFQQQISNQLNQELGQRQHIEQQLIDGLEALSDRMDQMSTVGWDQYEITQNSMGDPIDFATPTRDWQWIPPLEASEEQSVHKTHIDPRFTIPQNATLVGATTLTGLIGRVPVENRVVDPMPFKLLTGSDNLAANGHTIDGLAGSVWSGHAIGDWTLSCVSGTLTSVTFVFDDGRIATVGENRPDSEGLAWISDAHGTPCLPGSRKTNMKSWLVAQMGAGFVSGAANATSAYEVTQSNNLLGSTFSRVDGDLAKFLLGQSAANSSSALSNWLMDRADQEFDAVVLPSAQEVAVHVNRPIHIDYNTEERKLNYEERVIASINTDLH